MSILNPEDENSQFLQEFKLSDANIVFYDVQHKQH